MLYTTYNLCLPVLRGRLLENVKIHSYMYTHTREQMVLLILTEISYFIIPFGLKKEECKTEHANKNGWNFDRSRGTALRLRPPWNVNP